MNFAVALGLLLVTGTAIGGYAQDDETIVDPSRTTSDVFPYCPCITQPAAYKLKESVIFKGNNTYCFTVVVSVPPGCLTECCNTDLMKLEIDAEPACKVAGQKFAGTLNGVPLRIAPTFEKSVDVASNTYIIKMTGLNLTLASADNVEICLYMAPVKDKPACTTTEQICLPPKGYPRGVCRTALFNSNVKCCPLTDVNVPKPPSPLPPSPSPPPSPPSPFPPSPSPPPPPPCKTCVQVQTSFLTPYDFSPEECSTYSDMIIDDMTAMTLAANITMLEAFSLEACGAVIKVCGEFKSATEAANLQTKVEIMVHFWVSNITQGSSGCKDEFKDVTVIVDVSSGEPFEGRRLSDVGPMGGCLSASAGIKCEPSPPAFPNCTCETKPDTMVFRSDGEFFEMPARLPIYSLYCVRVLVDSITSPSKARCNKATTLLKVEFFANETYRRSIKSVALLPSGATNYKYLAPSWGAYGLSTLKATPVNWNTVQANGGLICLELIKPVTLHNFCLRSSKRGPAGCWFNFFDESKKCCPLYYRPLAILP